MRGRQGPAIRAGMDVHDRAGRYVGMVTRVYPAPERFTTPGGPAFGCFKVRRGPLPFFGPPPLLVPFDAIESVDEARVVLNAPREEAGRWASPNAEGGVRNAE